MIIKSKIFIPVIIMLIVVLGLIFFRPIKIGVLFSLDSSIGIEEKLSVQFYRRLFPKIGLRPVELIIENPKLDKTSIKESYKKLVKQNVSLIIGASLSQEGVIVAEISSEYSVPFISPTTSTIELKGVKDNFYRYMVMNTVQGEVPADYLNSMDIRNSVLLLSESNRAYSEPLADAFIKRFNGDVKKIFNDPDNPIPEQIVELNPESVFFVLPANEIISYLKTLRNELSNSILVTSTWGFQQLISVFSGDQINGIFVTTPSGDDVLSPYDDYSKKFQQEHKLHSTFATLTTLFAMEDIYTALNSVGSNREKLLEYFDRPRSVLGPYGNNYFDQYGDMVSEFFYLYEIENDELKLLYRVPIINDEYEN